MADQPPPLTGRDKDEVEMGELIFDALAKGHTLKEVRDLDGRDMEALYSVGHSLYQSGRYDKAHSVFKFLCLHDHLEPRWWVGLGMTRQRLKDYARAVEAYAYATLMDVEDPQPQLQAGYCLMAMGKYKEAQAAFEGTVLAAGKDPKHAECKSQAQALLGVVKAKSKEAQA
jgi:type III secretion system low calcium response chaperone LcrH/SycD